jgi:hypothetical protein
MCTSSFPPAAHFLHVAQDFVYGWWLRQFDGNMLGQWDLFETIRREVVHITTNLQHVLPGLLQ